MSTTHPVPLGFSDLTADECFVISLFREWCRVGPTRAIAEHKIACSVQADKSHAALDPLFKLFDEFLCSTLDLAEDTDLLFDLEEALLNLLSASDHPDKDRADVRECKLALATAEIRIRPCDRIDRSGHDQLSLRVAESFQAAFGRI